MQSPPGSTLRVTDLNLTPNAAGERPYLLEDHLVKLMEENYQLEKEVTLLEVQTANWRDTNDVLTGVASEANHDLAPLSQEMFRLRHLASNLDKMDQLRTEVRSKATFLTSLRVRLTQRRKEIEKEMVAGGVDSQEVTQGPWLQTPPRAQLSFQEQQRADLSNRAVISPKYLQSRGVLPKSKGGDVEDGQVGGATDLEIRAALISDGPTDTKAERGMVLRGKQHQKGGKSYGELEWERAEADMAALMRTTHPDIQKLRSDIAEHGVDEHPPSRIGDHLIEESAKSTIPLPDYLYSPADGSTLYKSKGCVPDNFEVHEEEEEWGNSSGERDGLPPSSSRWPITTHRSQSAHESESEADIKPITTSSSAADIDVLSPQLIAREEEFCKREICRLNAEHLDLKAQCQRQEKDIQRVITSKKSEKNLLDNKVARLTREIDELVEQMRAIRRANEPLPSRPKAWHRAEA